MTPNEESNFFVLTKDSGYSTAATRAQTSAVRSYLASQQHARERQHRLSVRENRRSQPRENLGPESRVQSIDEQALPPDLVTPNDTARDDSSFPEAGFRSPNLLIEENDARASLDFRLTRISPLLISLPVDLTTEERYSLQIFFTFARQKLLGTSTKPSYCPFSDLEESLTQICPIYVLAHVVVGELLLSQLTQQPVRPYYYARSAQMYTAVNSILADKKATLCHKLWAIIQVAFVEYTAQRHDLQAMHNRALDDLFESQGGVVAMYDAQPDDIYLQISSRLYATPLGRTAIINPGIRQFTIVKGRFILALHEIRDRIDLLRSESAGQYSSPKTPPPLPRLKIYLDRLIQNLSFHQTTEEDHEHELGAIFCLLSIARTFVEYPCSHERTLNFFSLVQDCLMDNSHARLSTAKGCTTAITYGISCVRSKMFPVCHAKTEFKISQTFVDAQRLFFLASPNKRIEIIKWLVACISTIAYLAGFVADFSDEMEKIQNFDVHLLAEELELSWQTSTAIDL